MATTITSTGELILIGTSKTTVNGVEFTASGATAAGGLIAPTLKPAADATDAIQLQTSGGDPVLTVDTTNKRLTGADRITADADLRFWTDHKLTEEPVVRKRLTELPQGSARFYWADQDDYYVYYSTAQSPGQVVRQSKINFSLTTLELYPGYNNAYGVVVDHAREYLYVSAYDAARVAIFKIDLASFQIVDLFETSSHKNARALAIDSTDTYLYVGCASATNLAFLRITLADFHSYAAVNTAGASGTLQDILIDATDTYAYASTSTSPSTIYRLTLSDFSTIASLALGSGKNNGLRLAIDSSATYLYVGLNISPAQIAKITIADFTTIAYKALASGENLAYGLGIDGTNTYLYIACAVSPGKIIRLTLADFTTTSTLTLVTGENQPYAGGALVDDSGTYLWIGCYMQPAKAVRLLLSDFSTTVTTTTLIGVEYMISMVIDSAGVWAYILLQTSPGRIVKLLLSDLRTYMLLEMSNSYTGAWRDLAIDHGDTYLYAAESDSPSTIARITLADFSTVDYKTLAAGENTAYGLTVDSTDTYLYIVCSLSPSKIVRLTLADFTTTSTLTLASGDNLGRSLVIDSTDTYLYTALFLSPGRVARVTLADFSTISVKTLAQNTPRRVIINATDTYIYLGHYLALADFATETVLTNADVAYAILVQLVGSHLIATTETSPARLWVIDVATFATLASSQMDATVRLTYGGAVAPDGSAYVASGAGGKTIIQLGSDVPALRSAGGGLALIDVDGNVVFSATDDLAGVIVGHGYAPLELAGKTITSRAGITARSFSGQNAWLEGLVAGDELAALSKVLVRAGAKLIFEDATIGHGNYLKSAAGKVELYIDNVKAFDVDGAGIDFVEAITATGGLNLPQSVADVSDPPTDAELDVAFGTPATLGRGFMATIDDNDGDLKNWLVWTSDASWYYAAGTKAV